MITKENTLNTKRTAIKPFEKPNHELFYNNRDKTISNELAPTLISQGS